MTAQYLGEWNPIAKTVAHTAVLSLLGEGEIRFYSNTDTLLGTADLDEPAGIINGTTGALEISAVNGTWSADGTVSYATLFDGNSPTKRAMQSLPCQTGITAIDGVCVLTSLNAVDGQTFAVMSWVFP